MLIGAGFNNVFSSFVVINFPFSSFQSGLSAATNFNPCGIYSVISVFKNNI